MADTDYQENLSSGLDYNRSTSSSDIMDSDVFVFLGHQVHFIATQIWAAGILDRVWRGFASCERL